VSVTSKTTFNFSLFDISTIAIDGTITVHISTNFFVIIQSIGDLIIELFIATIDKSLFKRIF
jgi:hypothetical protein